MCKMNSVLMILFLVLCACSKNSVSSQNLQAAKITGAELGLDVRTFGELERNPALGALHIPLTNLESSSDLPEDRNTRIYVFCESGKRAETATEILSARGYTNISNIKDWRAWNKIRKF